MTLFLWFSPCGSQTDVEGPPTDKGTRRGQSQYNMRPLRVLDQEFLRENYSRVMGYVAQRDTYGTQMDPKSTQMGQHVPIQRREKKHAGISQLFFFKQGLSLSEVSPSIL